MSRFSEELSRRVTEKGVSVSALAKSSGVERTSIYKMMTGERKPTELATAERLAEALMLSAAERKSFLSACRIDQMGESVYLRRKAVLGFFSGFDPVPPNSSAQLVRSEQHTDLKGVKTAYGSIAVYNLIREIVDLENRRPDAKICLLAQPDRGLLADYLALVGAQNQRLSVEHILCFENGRAEENGQYNFECMTKLLRLLSAGCSYRPYFFYDHVASRFSETGTLPFFVLTHTQVIAYSCDETKAVVSDTPEVLELYRRIFDELRQKSEPLAQSFDNVVDIITYWNSEQNRMTFLDYSFSYQPCLLPLLKNDCVGKYISPELAELDGVSGLAEEYIRGRTRPEWYGQIRHFFFLEASLDDFLRDGRVLEIPDEYYRPIDRQDRIDVLRRMADELEADRYRALILKPEAFRLSPSFSCGAYRDTVYLDIVVPDRSFVNILIEAKSVTSTLQDFFEYLGTSELVYTREETLAILRKKLASL